MSKPSLHRGAVHEAGHAVMARLLQVELGTIKIDLNHPDGAAQTMACATDDPAQTMRIAAASRACLRAFGFDTALDQGLAGDACVIQTALDELFEDDDETAQAAYVDAMDVEVEQLFNRRDVRAAVEVLVAALMRTGEISGPEAMAAIDQHLGTASPSGSPKLR